MSMSARTRNTIDATGSAKVSDTPGIWMYRMEAEAKMKQNIEIRLYTKGAPSSKDANIVMNAIITKIATNHSIILLPSPFSYTHNKRKQSNNKGKYH